jgi:uncharacterized protein
MQVRQEDANKILQSIRDDYLELIILPTEKCNFRCVYCYEDFSIGKMKPHIVTGIKNLIKNRLDQGLKELRISWFGGEPLLAKNVVLEISEFATDLVSQYPSLSYDSAMTTNGYLLDIDMLEKLTRLGVRDFQISFDGTPDVHDKTRLRADGAGTFNTIWANLLKAKKSDFNFQVMLRIHVTPDNLAVLPSLIDMVKKTFGDDNRFRIFFKAIEDLGGPKSKTFEILHKKDRNQIMQELYQLVGDALLIEKIELRKPYICYAAQANSFLIRATGGVGKCTVALDDDRNDIGHITPDGFLKLKNEKLMPWIRGLSTLDLKNLACPMMGLPKNQAILGSHHINVKVI